MKLYRSYFRFLHIISKVKLPLWRFLYYACVHYVVFEEQAESQKNYKEIA